MAAGYACVQDAFFYTGHHALEGAKCPPALAPQAERRRPKKKGKA